MALNRPKKSHRDVGLVWKARETCQGISGFKHLLHVVVLRRFLGFEEERRRALLTEPEAVRRILADVSLEKAEVCTTLNSLSEAIIVILSAK